MPACMEFVTWVQSHVKIELPAIMLNRIIIKKNWNFDGALKDYGETHVPFIPGLHEVDRLHRAMSLATSAPKKRSLVTRKIRQSVLKKSWLD